MAKSTSKAVETWDLGEMLEVLCQVAQDARDAENVPEADRKPRVAVDLPSTDQGGIRP